MTESKPFHTVNQVADMFEVRAATVRMWIKQGKLEAIKLPGGAIRIPDTSVTTLANTKYGDSSADS